MMPNPRCMRCNEHVSDRQARQIPFLGYNVEPEIVCWGCELQTVSDTLNRLQGIAAMLYNALNDPKEETTCHGCVKTSYERYMRGD